MMIAYGPNLEDVMLRRALRRVPRGVYVDLGVGAEHNGSATRHFREQGWQGFHVGANPVHTGGSRTRPSASSVTAPDRAPVSILRLASLWKSHLPEGAPVHLLVVDMQGREAEVLRGVDWHPHRPWLVMVRAWDPVQRTSSHVQWEPLLLEAAYRFAYTDGVNRFYVASEHEAELLPAFSHPPNVFDHFEPWSTAEARRLQHQAEQRAHEVQSHLEVLALHREAMLQSTSWRMTRPIRWLKDRVWGPAAPPPPAVPLAGLSAAGHNPASPSHATAPLAVYGATVEPPEAFAQDAAAAAGGSSRRHAIEATLLASVRSAPPKG